MRTRWHSSSVSIFVHDITRGKKVKKKLPVINDRRKKFNNE
jgi:hypothetical protein